MLVLDSIVALFVITITVAAATGLINTVRKKNHKRKGAKNAEELKRRSQEKCIECGVQINVDKDVWAHSAWWCVNCARKIMS